MIRTALATSLGIFAVLVGWVGSECVFLSEYRYVIWQNYAQSIAWFSLLAFLNLFAGVYGVLRKFALKDTGEKLSHVEKQLRGRTSVSDELSERIMQRK
jgi:hypothetical protein